MHVSYFRGSLSLAVTKRCTFSCAAVPLFFHVVLATLEPYIAVAPYLSPVDISPSASVTNDTTSLSFLCLLATVFASAVLTDDNHSAPDRGCMRDFPGFLQLRSYTTCKLIFWPIPVNNLAQVLCIRIFVRFSEIVMSNSDI